MSENKSIKVSTTRFGELDVNKEDVFFFPEGLLGFGPVKNYFILKRENQGPFEWLQAVDPPHLAFVICNPLLFKPDYRVKVKAEDLQSIKLDNLEDAVVYVILVVPQEPKMMTANLQGPLVFNPKEKLAKQLVLHGEEYTTRYRLFPDTQESQPPAEAGGG